MNRSKMSYSHDFDLFEWKHMARILSYLHDFETHNFKNLSHKQSVLFYGPSRIRQISQTPRYEQLFKASKIKSELRWNLRFQLKLLFESTKTFLAFSLQNVSKKVSVRVYSSQFGFVLLCSCSWLNRGYTNMFLYFQKTDNETYLEVLNLSKKLPNDEI